MKLTKILWQARAQSDAQQITVRHPQSWLTVALLLGVLLLAACQPIRSPDPHTVVQTYLDAAVAHNLSAALALAADDITHTDTHAPPGLPSVTQGKTAYGAYLQGALDDPAYRLDYAISATGTQQGEFNGIPATGKPIAIWLMVISRVVDNKIVEEWQLVDSLSLLQQLGVA